MVRIVGLVLLACAAGCAKSSAEPPLRAPPGPVRTTAQQLFEDFTRPDADGLVLLDKYRDGATFTATIKTVGVEEDGRPVVWIDIDGENLMTLELADRSLDGLAPGTRLTVTCKIGGASGALMMVTDCVRGV